MDRSLLKATALAAIVSLTTAQPALAYIDPNTGGILFQALAASFAVLTGIALIFSRQIRAGLARVRRFLREQRGSGQREIDEQHAD
jgi:hypothetical protein